jgi:spore maturation protein CgeB
MITCLFVGDLNTYGRSYLRYLNLKKLVNEVIPLSHSLVDVTGIIKPPTLINRLFTKLRIPPDETGVNKKILNVLNSKKINFIWIEKGNTIKPSTLWLIKKKYPKIKLISLSEDDMYVKHGSSYYYRKGLKYYDHVFTTK